MTITVLGVPMPQGSKRHIGQGVLVESSKGLRPWRDSVTLAAREAMNGTAAPYFTGAVAVHAVFTMPKPMGAPKSRRFPDRRPDVDKLQRAIFDSLTDAGVIIDDGRIVYATAVKEFPVPGGSVVGSLDVPGVRIEVVPL